MFGPTEEWCLCPAPALDLAGRLVLSGAFPRPTVSLSLCLSRMAFDSSVLSAPLALDGKVGGVPESGPGGRGGFSSQFPKLEERV